MPRCRSRGPGTSSFANLATAPQARFLIHAGDLVNDANSDQEWGEWFHAGGWIDAIAGPPQLPATTNMPGETPGRDEALASTS